MPTRIELLDVRTLFWRAAWAKTWPFRALGGEQGSRVLLGREISWLLLQGVCLLAFKGHSHLNGLLWLCSWVWFQRTQSCGMPLPITLPLLCELWDFHPTVQFKISPGTQQLACKSSSWKGCFKWSLLLLYKPSFKIDYKMFLNLPNTH